MKIIIPATLMAVSLLIPVSAITAEPEMQNPEKIYSYLDRQQPASSQVSRKKPRRKKTIGNNTAPYPDEPDELDEMKVETSLPENLEIVAEVSESGTQMEEQDTDPDSLAASAPQDDSDNGNNKGQFGNKTGYTYGNKNQAFANNAGPKTQYSGYHSASLADKNKKADVADEPDKEDLSEREIERPERPSSSTF